jgi:hypothetical protein
VLIAGPVTVPLDEPELPEDPVPGDPWVDEVPVVPAPTVELITCSLAPLAPEVDVW